MQEINRWGIDPGVTKDTYGWVVAVVCFGTFALAMATVGVVEWYGLLYVASMLSGFLILLRLRPVDLRFDKPVVAQIAATFAFLLLCSLHVIVLDSPVDQLDTVTRIPLGLINGAFFMLLFSRSSEAALQYLLLIAGMHTVLAIGIACSAGMAGLRAGGATNPIPFSEMLAVSAGIVAIAGAARIERDQLWQPLALALFLLLTMVALVFTGTRGTLVVALPLIFMMALALRVRARPLHIAGTLLAALAMLILADYLFFNRMALLFDDAGTLMAGGDVEDLSASVRVRLELWISVLELVSRHPLTGYGLGAFPDLLRDPILDLPPDSPLLRYNHVHNQYLDILLETGLVGLVMFLSLLAIPFAAAWRALGDPARRVPGLCLIWVVSAYAVFGFSQTFLAHATTSIHFGVYVGMLLWIVVYRDDRGWTPRDLLARRQTAQNALT